MARKLIMSWSKCKIEVGRTLKQDLMANYLFNLGIIKDKSTTLSCEESETLKAISSGGKVVAEESREYIYKITTRVIEMGFNIESILTGANIVGTIGEELTVKTNVIHDDFFLKLTPKNIGATGIKVRRAHVSFRPGLSEEEGHYVDVTFKILACEDGELYKKFKVVDEHKRQLRLISKKSVALIGKNNFSFKFLNS